MIVLTTTEGAKERSPRPIVPRSSIWGLLVGCHTAEQQTVGCSALSHTVEGISPIFHHFSLVLFSIIFSFPRNRSDPSSWEHPLRFTADTRLQRWDWMRGNVIGYPGQEWFLVRICVLFHGSVFILGYIHALRTRYYYYLTGGSWSKCMYNIKYWGRQTNQHLLEHGIYHVVHTPTDKRWFSAEGACLC